MAIAFIRVHGTPSARVSGSTLIYNPTATITVGTLLVAFISSDNLSATTPTFTFSDTKSNTWSTVVQGATNATPAAGAAGAIGICKVTTEITTSDAVTCTLSGAVLARAGTMWAFSGAAGTWRSTTGLATGASGSPSVTITSPVNGDLVVGHVAVEDNTSPTAWDTDTTNGSWTNNSAVYTSGGAAAANIASDDSYKIVTGTGSQTYNLSTNNADWVAMAVSLIPAASTVTRTATGSGTGSATNSQMRKRIRTATASATGSATNTQIHGWKKTASASGAGNSTAPRVVTANRTATGSGAGDSTSTRVVVNVRNASGSGTGTESASGTSKRARSATGSGTGDSTAVGEIIHRRAGTGNGSSSQSATGLHIAPRTADSTGTGAEATVSLVTRTRTADGQGTSGSGTNQRVIAVRTASASGEGASSTVCRYSPKRTGFGAGAGSSSCTWQVQPGGQRRNATGTGTGSSTVFGGKTHYLYYTLPGWREPRPVSGREKPALGYTEPRAVEGSSR